MKATKNNANANANNANAKMQVNNNARTSTQAAADAAKREEARAQKAAEKALQKAAVSYNAFGLIADARNTPSQACKRFYTTACAVCDGAFAQVLTEILGKTKNDFTETYAQRVKAAFVAKKRKNYTDFLVWGVVYEDLKFFTRADIAKADPKTAQAVQALADAMQARKEEKDAAK